ncbi:MAG: translation initiation factor IF-2 [Verrucomicrobiota bacterium]
MASESASEKSKAAVAAAKKKAEDDKSVVEEEAKKKEEEAKKKKKEVLSLIDEEGEEEEGDAQEEKGDDAAASGEQGESDAGSEEGEEAAEEESGEEEIDPAKIINIKPPIIVKDLAEAMGLKPFKIIQDLLQLEVFVSQDKSIEPDIAVQLCEKHGFVFEREKREKGGGVHKVEEVIEEPEAPPEVETEGGDELQLRPPIITFMGHVDHGKTSLMDALRESRVTAGEAGGITQHVGAYSIEKGGKKITLIDTPGHAAFTEMRARGANVTDIVVLVIAADDGVMPQTKEAIDHAKAAGVTIMVAVNKVDMKGADPMKVRTQLQEMDLTPEDWGGETVCVDVSATEGTGLDTLVEMMALQAEVLELKANPDAAARGTVIEAKMEAGKGPTATVIVSSGTLKPGIPFICGPHSGKVKSLINDRGEQVKEASPATPVEVLGFNGLPNVGDELVEMENERAAKRLSEARLDELRKEKLEQPKRSTLESLFASIDDATKKVLKIVLKTDVAGTAEAIIGELKGVDSDKVDVDILHSSAGPITESDVLLASASDAIIIGFNTKVEGKAVSAAKREGVQVKLYSVIYELIDQMREAMLGMLDPEMRENVVGHAKVKEIFKLSGGRVAGCLVSDGKILRAGHARVLRGDQPVYDGAVQTLRRFQDDVNEVRNGLECGIRLGNFNEYEVEDVIECYELEKIDQTL